MFYLQLTLLLVGATALALWCGWGIARLTLPPSLRPYRGLLAPLLGYAVAIITGYWGVWTVFGLHQILPALLVTTGVINAVAWRRTGPPRRIPRGESIALLLLLLITLLVGVAPLLRYNHPAIIGGGWDTENYLPTARYLERGPVSAIQHALPNPLRDINAAPPRIGLTLGFSVWQGLVDLLTGMEAITSFAPLLAWLRALGVLGIYVLFRATLGLCHWPALWGAAWTSAGALLLWISYFNFGMQLSGWPLIPLGLVVGVAAVEDLATRGRRAWPVALGAAMTLAALPVAYYPALTLFAPLAAGIGLATLAGSTHRLRLLTSAGAIALATLLLAAPTIIDYGRGFAFRYSGQLTTLGVFHFIPLTDVLGLTPFLLHAEPVAPTLAVWLAAFAVALLMLVGLPHAPQRSRWLGASAGVAAYLVWLRWGQAYHYAYMKGSAYAAFVLLGLAAAGWQVVSQRLPRRMRLIAAVIPLLLLLPMARSQGEIVTRHWDGPGLYADELPALLDLRQLVPPGSTVKITSDQRARGVKTGIAAYMLDHATVLGYAQTGYATSAAGEPADLGEYALLLADEDPAPAGYRDSIWRGGGFALYRRPDATHAHLWLDRTLAPGDSWTLTVGSERLIAGDGSPPGDSARGLTITTYALEDTALTIDDAALSIPSGAARVTLGSVDTPRTVTISNRGESPVTLGAATLIDAVRVAETVEHIPAAVVARADAEADGAAISATINLRLPDSGPLVAALDVWNTAGTTQYGWYGIEVGPCDCLQTFRMRLDIPTGTVTVSDGSGQPLPVGAQFNGLAPGEYIGRLTLGAGDTVLAAPAELFFFTISNEGEISGVVGRQTGMLAATLDRPPEPLRAHVGDDVAMLGYDLATPKVRAGETAGLTLWWNALRALGEERSVLVHLLDESGNKVAEADGPPAGGAWPTSSWRAGDVIIDRRSLPVPASLPPGRYTIAVGMYRWPSLERLPVLIDGAQSQDGLVHVPIEITAGD